MTCTHRGGPPFLNDGSGHEKRLPIVRTNRLMQGIAVPAGVHRVVVRYLPSSYVLGAIISLSAWLALIVMASRTFIAARSGSASGRIG